MKRFIREMMFRWFGARGFAKILSKSHGSRAYGQFCEIVYGRDLCQFNMIDEEQLQKLMEILNLNASHKVLDLGCSVGKISEYISDTSSARVTGIDYARKAIQLAGARTIQKRERLHFLEANMNALPPAIGKFDAVIAMDTLYFVQDLEATVQNLLALLKPGGQLAIFYTCKIEPHESRDGLLADQNKLAKSLKNAKATYRAWDFSKNQGIIFKNWIDVAERLKPSFEEEKNLDLYKARIEEGQRCVQWTEKGLTSRFLYHIKI